MALVGLLFGLAVARQDEFRADHFAAWLTQPEWVAAHFRERARFDAFNGTPILFQFKWLRRRGLPNFPGLEGAVDSLERLIERFITTHPTNEARVKRAESYRAAQ